MGECEQVAVSAIHIFYKVAMVKQGSPGGK